MIRWINNPSCTVASGFRRERDRLWFCPLTMARKGFVDGRTTVVSLMFLWGWDAETPFSVIPSSRLGRRFTGTRKELIDVTLTLSWLGFAVVVHGCTDPTRSEKVSP